MIDSYALLSAVSPGICPIGRSRSIVGLRPGRGIVVDASAGTAGPIGRPGEVGSAEAP